MKKQNLLKRLNNRLEGKWILWLKSIIPKCLNYSKTNNHSKTKDSKDFQKPAKSKSESSKNNLAFREPEHKCVYKNYQSKFCII